jgi:multiple sugar transport system substrate-binding protein
MPMHTGSHWDRIWLSLLFLLPLLFTACQSNTVNTGSGSGGSNNTGQILHVLVDYNGSYPTRQKQWMQQVNNDLQKETGASIAWDTYNGTSDEQTKLQTATITGSGPDIFSLGTTFVPTAQATKGFTVLTDQDWQAIGGRNKFFPQQLTMSGSSPNQQIAVPWRMQPFSMVYNTTLFKKAGITSPPTTWTEFVDDARAMTDAKNGIYGTEIDPSDSFDPWKILWMFSEQLGGNFLSPDLHTAQLNSPETKTAVEFWFDWATKYHIVDPNSVSWKATDAFRNFANGKIGMMIMVTPTIIPSLDQSQVKGQYAFTPMPTIPYGLTQRPANGKPAATIVAGYMLAVANYSSLKDLAFKFINLITGYQQQLQWSKDFGDLPANAEAAKYLGSKSPQTAAFLKAETGAVPTPFSGAWGPIEVSLAGVCSQLANQVATNHYSPGDIQPLLNQANQQIQNQLQ